MTDPDFKNIVNGFGNNYEDVTGEKQYLSFEDLEEMESVIYSISFGKMTNKSTKKTYNKSVTYQAYSAAIS